MTAERAVRCCNPWSVLRRSRLILGVALTPVNFDVQMRGICRGDGLNGICVPDLANPNIELTCVLPVPKNVCSPPVPERRRPHAVQVQSEGNREEARGARRPLVRS